VRTLNAGVDMEMALGNTAYGISLPKALKEGVSPKGNSIRLCFASSQRRSGLVCSSISRWINRGRTKCCRIRVIMTWHVADSGKEHDSLRR
jgi:hypothetical protein